MHLVAFFSRLLTCHSIEGQLPSSFPRFEYSDVMLYLGVVSGSLNGVVEHSVVSEEAHCRLDTVTKVIDIDEEECRSKDRALGNSWYY